MAGSVDGGGSVGVESVDSVVGGLPVCVVVLESVVVIGVVRVEDSGEMVDDATDEEP